MNIKSNILNYTVWIGQTALFTTDDPQLAEYAYEMFCDIYDENTQDLWVSEPLVDEVNQQFRTQEVSV